MGDFLSVHRSWPTASQRETALSLMFFILILVYSNRILELRVWTASSILATEEELTTSPCFHPAHYFQTWKLLFW
jgi:hypothetical protein